MAMVRSIQDWRPPVGFPPRKIIRSVRIPAARWTPQLYQNILFLTAEAVAGLVLSRFLPGHDSGSPSFSAHCPIAILYLQFWSQVSRRVEFLSSGSCQHCASQAVVDKPGILDDGNRLGYLPGCGIAGVGLVYIFR